MHGYKFYIIKQIAFIHLSQPDSHTKELYWYETQGDWFAGQLLVPTSQLERYCIDLLESNRDQFSKGRYLSHEFWSYASNALAEPFEVNPIVIEIRIRQESFAEKFKDYYR